ncbi:MAG: hypothetical protein IKP36_01240 [Bacteroidaceae bacterium]|nr:hypothetical protein [Bacteroidaceae bacterium]
MKRAYHDILFADGTLKRGPVVVETTAEGRFLGWHILQEEEAFTEWHGGTAKVPGNYAEKSSS